MPELAPGPYEVDGEALELDVDGHGVDAFHARPEGMPRAGLVLIPDMMGIRPLFEDLCRRLASHGLAVVAVEPFAFVARAERPESVEARAAGMHDFDDEAMLAAFEAAADWLVIHDDVGEVNAVGFCMGGMYALKAASTGRFDRVVAFYGMITLPDDWRGPRVRAAAELLEQSDSPSPFLAVLGGRDPFTPEPDVERLRAIARSIPGAELRIYPEAEHGFVHDPARSAHRGDDAADAWRQALDYLGAAPRDLSL